MTIVFPWPPKALNPNARVHWAKKSKAARQYRENCRLLALEAIRRYPVSMISERMHLFIDFYPPDKRRRDDDNCYSSFKSGRDGIADAFRVDDKRFVGHPYLKDEVVKGGEVRVKICKGP